MLYEQTTFENATLVLDDNEFKACDFRNCTLIYRGGPYLLQQCSWAKGTLQFEDAAHRTLEFLRFLYGLYPDGPSSLESLFDTIRQKRDLTPSPLTPGTPGQC